MVETNLRAHYHNNNDIDNHRNNQHQPKSPQQQLDDDDDQTAVNTSYSTLLWNWLVATVSSQLSSSLSSSSSTLFPGAVGINLGKNRDSVDADDVVADYRRLIRQLGPLADYLVVNVSSPNTAGLREWQTGEALRTLLLACLDERDQLVAAVSDDDGSDETKNQTVPPLLVKLAPDLTDDQLREIATTCLQVGVDGLVVSNTTHQRPADLIHHHLAGEEGGLSGTPVKSLSTHCIRVLYAAVRGQIPIIGVGGVANGLDAYEKLRAGASLVQVYSTLVYQGPGVVSRIRHELAQHILTLHGPAAGVSDVVGLDHEALVWEQRHAQTMLEQFQTTPNAAVEGAEKSPLAVGFNDNQ